MPTQWADTMSINPPMYTLRSWWLWLVRAAPGREGGRTQEWTQTPRPCNDENVLRNDVRWGGGGGGGGQQPVRPWRSLVVRLRALDRATDDDYCHNYPGANQAQTLWPLWQWWNDRSNTIKDVALQGWSMAVWWCQPPALPSGCTASPNSGLDQNRVRVKKKKIPKVGGIQTLHPPPCYMHTIANL